MDLGKSPRTVSLPTLSLVGLWLIRREFGKGTRVKVHVDPIPVKVLERVFRVRDSWLLGGLSRLLGLEIERPVRAQRQGSTGEQTFQAMMATTAVTEALSTDIAGAGWMALLAELVGEREAIAFFKRRFSQDVVYMQLLGVVAARQGLGEEELPVLFSALWPEHWQRLIDETLRPLRIRALPWPSWYVRLQRGVARGTAIAKLAALFGRAARQGIRTQGDRQSATLAAELIDEGRMGGAHTDANCFEDERRLPRDSFVFYLTRGQRKFIRRHGGDPDQVITRLREKGFRIVEPRKLRYSVSSLRRAATFAWPFLKRALRAGPVCLAPSFTRGIDVLLEYRALFDNVLPRNHLATPWPNGSTGGRFDSGVITGLCRKEGIRSVGYQTRIIYDQAFEDCYDCYDTYLTWGRGWTDVLDGCFFTDQIIEIGDLNNDNLEHGVRRARDSRSLLVVTIFTSEMSSTYAPLDSLMRLLGTCVELAERNPDCQFQVKTKDREMVPEILGDASFRRRAESVAKNFRFLDLPRFACAELIAGSDIVIAAAHTTPGVDALVLGRRVIFYNEIVGFGQVFARFPDLVAHTPDELERLFAVAKADFLAYAQKHHHLLETLDPFRDGAAKARALDALVGPALLERFRLPVTPTA